MSNQMVQLQDATIKAHCKMLRMPTVASQFGSLPVGDTRRSRCRTTFIVGLFVPAAQEVFERIGTRPHQDRRDESGVTQNPKMRQRES
jgi:hypothetical protein